MPRPPKQKLKLDYDSLQSHIQEVYNQLDELKQKAVRDYNKVQSMMIDPTSIVSLEPTRNNSLKALGDFHKSKLDLLKVHLNVVQAKDKQGVSDIEGEDDITTATSEDMQKWYRQLEEMKKENKKEKGGV